MRLSPSWEANINIKLVLRTFVCDTLIRPPVSLMIWHRIVEGLVIGELAYVSARVCMCGRKRSWPNLNYYFGISWIDCEEKSKHFSG